MNNKRHHDEYGGRKDLQNAGWQIHKRDAVAFNSGSETDRHLVAKALVAKVLRDRGYRVDTEVVKEGVGEIDVVAYGLDEPPFAVEVETNPTKAVVSDKVSRYYRGEPFCECYVLDVDDLPDSIADAREWVEAQI
ncbi:MULTISPECIES: hypothetical protein [Halobacterium]|uniref:hypothetical protein n=1 Tax=Halobacterium TaxID=2239 RepID=UPI00073F28FE|nr:MULTISPECIES: hypothetical protein [Halobacterium]MCG1003084.1 hypothetical protein [Halobacterium noricense]